MNKSMKKIGKTLVSVSLAAAMAVTMAASAGAYGVKDLGAAGYLTIDNSYRGGGWYTWYGSKDAAKQFPEFYSTALTNMTRNRTTLNYKVYKTPTKKTNGTMTPTRFYSGDGVVAAIFYTTDEATAIKAAGNLTTIRNTEFEWLKLEGGYILSLFKIVHPYMLGYSFLKLGIFCTGTS